MDTYMGRVILIDQNMVKLFTLSFLIVTGVEMDQI